jgi:hypothetical protein
VRATGVSDGWPRLTKLVYEGNGEDRESERQTPDHPRNVSK